ncbi:MAG: hypothetical protein WAO98_09900 [Alphaproteobacteria bacterium]
MSAHKNLTKRTKSSSEGPSPTDAPQLIDDGDFNIEEIEAAALRAQQLAAAADSEPDPTKAALFDRQASLFTARSQQLVGTGLGHSRNAARRRAAEAAQVAAAQTALRSQDGPEHTYNEAQPSVPADKTPIHRQHRVFRNPDRVQVDDDNPVLQEVTRGPDG